MAERDYGAEAQEAAEEHLSGCWDWFDQEEYSDDLGLTKSPASAPFDGCPTCEVREILFAAWPIIEEGIRNGDLTREGVSKAGLHDG